MNDQIVDMMDRMTKSRGEVMDLFREATSKKRSKYQHFGDFVAAALGDMRAPTAAMVEITAILDRFSN